MAMYYHRKMLPLIAFGVLLIIVGQQLFLSHSVQATHIDQELSGRLRQRELAEHGAAADKRRKSKKSKSKKSSKKAAEPKAQQPPQPPRDSQQA